MAVTSASYACHITSEDDATDARLSGGETRSVSHTAELSRRDDEASEGDTEEALADLWE
jgi:hypothetical protein